MSSPPRRVVFAGQNDCRIEDYALPKVAPGRLLVRNLVSLVSAGTELAILRKRHRAFSTGGSDANWIQYPFYPGYTAVGRIEELADDVSGFHKGEIVWHGGGHEEMSSVDATKCTKVPAGVAPEDAVFFGLAEIAMTSVRRAPTLLGQSVLVSGLGLVGLLCAQLYKVSGAVVTVADPSTGRVERAHQLGLDFTIDLSTTSFHEWFTANPSYRPDMSVEAAGVESNINACLKWTKDGGRVVLLGSPRNTMEIDPYTDIHAKGLTIIGAHANTLDSRVRAADVNFLFSLCAGPLRLDKLRTHRTSFLNMPKLYDLIEKDLDVYLGVVLTYGDELE